VAALAAAFLLAHCRLAYAHDFIYFANIDHTETRLALAETSVGTAVRLQPDSGETHLAQAIHFYWGHLDYLQAREELAKAQRGLPNNAELFQFLGFIDWRQGRWEEAIRNLKHTVDLDPRNIDMNGALGATYFMLRRYGEAIAIYNRALALEPRNNYMQAYVASCPKRQLTLDYFCYDLNIGGNIPTARPPKTDGESDAAANAPG
jgi:tetratricopeptide (TPR) repeat protein